MNRPSFTVIFSLFYESRFSLLGGLGGSASTVPLSFFSDSRFSLIGGLGFSSDSIHQATISEALFSLYRRFGFVSSAIVLSHVCVAIYHCSTMFYHVLRQPLFDGRVKYDVVGGLMLNGAIFGEERELVNHCRLKIM